MAFQVVSDQYASREFAQFAQEHHTTSSPHFLQSNGQAERGVQTVKKLLTGSKDPFMSLLTYRATPLPWCNLSPAELLMGRAIRSNVPQLIETLTPQWPYLKEFRQRNSEQQENARHRTKSLPEILEDTAVWVNTDNTRTPGHIMGPAGTPRSYIVETPSGSIRRNRVHLTAILNSQSPSNTNIYDFLNITESNNHDQNSYWYAYHTS